MQANPPLTSAQSSLLQGTTIGLTSPKSVVEFVLRHGWAAATTRQYAAAVNKFSTFVSTMKEGGVSLPATSHQIYHFILWCSTSGDVRLSSTTIKRYLTGLRMWHALHDAPFPAVNYHRVRLILKACLKTELKKPKRIRTGLLLRDVLDLTDALMTGNHIDLVIRAVILVGFWGLARLGELTLHHDHPLIFLRRKDVKFSEDGTSVQLSVRMAKTASHGERQLIRLRSQPNRLDPVNIIHKVLRDIPGAPRDPLFPGRDRLSPIDRSLVVNFLKANGPQEGNMWGGHSLRIGGASFQHNAGRPVSSLKRLGRWKSSAYKTYVNKYTPRVQQETLELSRLLHF